MANSGYEQYKNHPVWTKLHLKLEALRSSRFDESSAEELRTELISILALAKSSEKNGKAYIYMDPLQELENYIDAVYIGGTSNQFVQSYGQYRSYFHQAIRSLPGPRGSEITKTLEAELVEMIEVRDTEIQELRKALVEQASQALTLSQELLKIKDSAKVALETTSNETARISQAATDFEVARAEFRETQSSVWQSTHDKLRDTFQAKADSEIALLATAANVGKRLVEIAATNLTALSWVEKAERERKSGTSLRRASIGAFITAAILGGFVAYLTFSNDHQTGLGDALIRIAVITAVSAIGAYLSVESRRHLREADSAEEVSMALSALEPFLANSEDESRSAIRNELGETLFIQNVRSRFGSRDANKHSSLDPSQMQGLVDTALKAAELPLKATKN